MVKRDLDCVSLDAVQALQSERGGRDEAEVDPLLLGAARPDAVHPLPI